MSPGPSPTMLADWISLGSYWWLVLGCIAVTYLGVLTVQLSRVWEEDDAANEDAQDDHAQQQVDRYHCAGHGCQLRTFYSDEGGATWVCVNCERSYWVPVADVPYDRENGVA